jgi:SOUL heme-binding protein
MLSGALLVLDVAQRGADMFTKIALGLAGLLVVFLAAWIVYSLIYSRGTEQAAYKVVRTAADYEIRQYPELLVAETAMPEMTMDATRSAFGILAGYIFGGNEGSQQIAMTTPVTMAAKPESIAMTAPVLVGGAPSGPRTMAFSMPAKYTLETLPKPKDARVTFRKVPPRTVAAMRYTWYSTPARFAAKSADLAAALKRDNVKATSAPIYAGYDAPFVVPFLMRNEVLVEVAQ